MEYEKTGNNVEWVKIQLETTNKGLISTGCCAIIIENHLENDFVQDHRAKCKESCKSFFKMIFMQAKKGYPFFHSSFQMNDGFCS